MPDIILQVLYTVQNHMVLTNISYKSIVLMTSVGLAKLLQIGVRIYSIVEAASPPKNNSFKILNI
jgi:hypothetical protein